MSHVPHQRHSAAEWQALIEEHAQSGISHIAFCRAKGLAISTFHNWKRRLRNAPAHDGVVTSSAGALFVPLRAATGANTANQPVTTSQWDVELELGDGVILRLRRPA